jgi:hypothetical protein
MRTEAFRFSAAYIRVFDLGIDGPSTQAAAALLIYGSYFHPYISYFPHQDLHFIYGSYFHPDKFDRV